MNTEEIKETLVKLAVMLTVITTIIAIGSGLLEGTQGCTYQSVSAYHPLRVITCELLRPRFK